MYTVQPVTVHCTEGRFMYIVYCVVECQQMKKVSNLNFRTIEPHCTNNSKQGCGSGMFCPDPTNMKTNFHGYYPGEEEGRKF